nr:FimD/PapC C-terminal domain-containing protein [Escherichia coli]
MVYISAHNVYYVKSCLSDAKCFSGSRYSNAACAIDSESMNQTVELGQVRSSRLAKAGDLSSAVGFNIKLNDCDTNVSSNAAVAFLGTTVTSNDDTLALQSSAAGSAQNVGIQILDRTGEVLILDGATFSAKTDLIDVMTLKYGNKSVPFGAIVTHGENKNGSIVAENGQVYLTGLPQSGKLQVSWGKDKNSNCIVEYKLPEVSPGTLLNQQTAICR